MTELWHYFIMAFSKFSHTAGTRSPMYFSCKAMAHRSFLSCTTPWQYRTAFADFHRPKTSHYCHERQLTHTRLTALFPGLPRWAGTRKVKPIWILLKQETVSGSGISWYICKSAPHSRQITTPAPHRSVFYRPDALPAAQPTASKHWRHHKNVFKSCFIPNVQNSIPILSLLSYLFKLHICGVFLSQAKPMTFVEYVLQIRYLSRAKPTTPKH